MLESKDPGLYNSIQPNQDGAKKIWIMLGSAPETIPIYNYFCAKLAATDIDYLLTGIIHKILSNRPAPVLEAPLELEKPPFQ